jgi:simple sugar transport system permease protein
VNLRLERRLVQPWWLTVVVPVVSLTAAFAVMAVVLVLTGHSPGHTYRRLFDAALVGSNALSNTLISATPLVFTGLAAAIAFRMQIFNIGGEGQLYFGCIGAAAAALVVGGDSAPLLVLVMVLGGALCGALWAAIPGVLRAYFRTNEILTSLMLNYVAGLFFTYLIFDSHSFWRDSKGFQAKVFPQGKPLPDAATWSTLSLGNVIVPLGFAIAVVIAVALWALFKRTRFGFEMRVIGNSWRAAEYAGMRTKRMIVAVMCLSGAVAGVGGASQEGDFRHLLDPKGTIASNYGYAGIVVGALARYNPLAVVLVAFFLGGLQNAGYTLQGADFPAGLVGVMQGLILFCALGGELLVRYRVRVVRHTTREPVPVREGV